MFVAKKEQSDLGADRSNFYVTLQLVPASSPFRRSDVALSKSVSYVHTATSSAKRLTCGAPTAVVGSSM